MSKPNLNKTSDIIQEILKIPAVAVRGHRDDLLDVQGEMENAVFKWNVEALKCFPEHELRQLHTFAQKRYEYQTKKY